MAPFPKLPPLFGGAGGASPAGVDLPQAIVTADDVPAPAVIPGADLIPEETQAADPVPVDHSIKTGRATATVSRPAPAGRIIQADAHAFVTLTDQPYPREMYVGVPVGAPTAAGAHTMMIYASAADRAQLIAARGQTGAGATVPTTPLVIPASGAWVRVTNDVTLHVIVFGF